MDVRSVNDHGVTGRQAAPVLLEIVRRLEIRGEDYVIIHARDRIRTETFSDIDFAFSRSPVLAIQPVLLEMQNEGRLLVVQRLHYDVPECYYFVVAVPTADGADYLQLDCLCDPYGINKYHITSKDFLQGRRDDAGLSAPRPAVEALYLLVKKAKKGSITPHLLEHVNGLVGREPAEFQELALRYLGWSALDLMLAVVSAVGAPDVPDRLRRLAACIQGVERRAIGRMGARYAFQSWRGLRRILHPTGLFVVLLGTDGSGKSTIASGMVSGLSGAFRRVHRFHWRPKLLPKLSRRAVSEADTARPSLKSKYGFWVSLVRYLYYYADFLVGGWIGLGAKLRATSLIIGERYFYDLFVHPSRYAFSLPGIFYRAGMLFIRKPDIVIVLGGNAEQIWSRKKELPLEEVQRQLDLYSKVARMAPKRLVIDTGMGVDQTLRKVIWAILEETAQKNGFLKPGGRECQYFAWPSKAKARLYIPAETSDIGVALSAYAPGSLILRAFRAIYPYIPGFLRAAHARKNSVTGEESRQIGRLAEILGRHFGAGEREYVVYQGTHGPREKLTAQVIEAGKVRCYAKFAMQSLARDLVRVERHVLQDIVTRLRSSDGPRVVGWDESDAETLIIVSVPAVEYREHVLTIDSRISDIVAELFSLEPTRVAVESYIESWSPPEEDVELCNLRAGLAACISKGLSGKEVLLTRAHGDFAPWNMLDCRDGRLFVFDWEYSAAEYPALFDLFHYLVMPQLLVSGREWLEVVQSITAPGGKYSDWIRSVSGSCGVAENEIGTYFALYLWEILKRGVVRDAKDGGVVSTPLGRRTEFRDMLRHVTRQNERRPRVLVSAYACEPGKGSEPAVGWNMVKAVAEVADAWVITRTNNRQSIEAARRNGEVPDVTFVYTDVPRYLSFWKKGGRGIRTYYYLWQFSALRKASRLCRLTAFDIAHHVTFVNDWLFSSLGLLNIPFVWGPIGSHPRILPGMASTPKQQLLDNLRTGFQSFMRYLDPLFWIVMARAKLVIGISDEVFRRGPLRWVESSKRIVHTAIGLESEWGMDGPADEARAAAASSLRIISMGRLIPIKGLHLAVRAFADYLARGGDGTYTIVGRGAEASALKDLAQKLGIGERVIFEPWLSRDQVRTRLTQSDVFLYPSFESGGIVVLEAMAVGVPVVCLDYAGPGQAVAQCGGIRVKAEGRDGAVSDLASALLQLSGDGKLRKVIADEAKTAVWREYGWNNRPARIREWYAKLLEGRGVSGIVNDAGRMNG